MTYPIYEPDQKVRVVFGPRRDVHKAFQIGIHDAHIEALGLKHHTYRVRYWRQGKGLWSRLIPVHQDDILGVVEP